MGSGSPGLLRTSKSFQSQVPDIYPSWSLNVCLPPPKSSPSRPGPTPSSAAICGVFASWRLFSRKSRVPRGLQKPIIDAFSTSIFERLGSVLEGQDGSQIDQKSIKIEFSSLSVSASIFTSIFHRFFLPTSTHWISKKYVFPNEKPCFLKKTRFPKRKIRFFEIQGVEVGCKIDQKSM